MRRPWRRFGTIVFVWVILLAALPEAQCEILAQRVEIGANAGSSVRRVISGDAWPSVMFDGMPIQMNVRSEPPQSFSDVKPAQFPVRGREVAVPAGAIAATLEGRRCRSPSQIRGAL
jgi:hypothetical protein